jgi:hypothetical protein
LSLSVSAAGTFSSVESSLSLVLTKRLAAPGIGVIAFGYVITLVGVVLGAIYRELQARRARGEQRIATIPGLFGDVFRSIDFWMSACASPIVYALLWKSFAGGGIAALTIVGLQNGFCCTVILDRLTTTKAAPGAADHPL